METYKIYYEKATGYLCDRFPKNLEHDGSTPCIEVGKDDYERTFDVDYGKFWAVKGGSLQIVDDTETQATDEYMEYVKGNEVATLKAYLTETDYVISKLNELRLEDESEYETERARYSDILTRRKEARARINELEG